MIEVAQKAFGKENVDYQLMPWRNAVFDTRKGKFDGIVGAATSDAPDFIQSFSLGRSTNCFYERISDSWKYTNHASIVGKKLGYIGAYAYPGFIMNYIKNAKTKNKNVVRYGDGALLNLLRMIESKQIDIITDDEAVLKYMIENNPDLKTKVKNAGCTKTSEDITNVGISFPPKNKERSLILVNQLNKTIRTMIENGEMDALVKKYHMKKWW